NIRQQVVELERLARLRDPFGARRRAALAALVDRQPQRVDQRLDLVARGPMRDCRPQPERLLVEFVERGEPAREEFAIDHALGETVDAAKAELLAKPRSEEHTSELQ